MHEDDPGEVLARQVSAPSPAEVNDPAAARRMVSAYERLVAFESSVLEDMRGLRDAAPADLHPMIDSSNIRPMEQLIEEFKERVTIWSRRLEELSQEG